MKPSFILPDPKTKPHYVQEMFNKIATSYDLLNDIISLFQHRLWKHKAIHLADIQTGDKILDLCCGTGDLAIFIAQKYKETVHITAVDFSEKMLQIARQRAAHLAPIEFIQGDALNLPFNSNHFDVVFISFGLRNLQDISTGLQEMVRVTKQGGKIINLDLGKPKGYFWSKIFQLYFQNIVPMIGTLVYGEEGPYKYLPESMRTFPPPEEIIKIFLSHGVSNAKNHNLSGGAVALQVAVK